MELKNPFKKKEKEEVAETEKPSKTLEGHEGAYVSLQHIDKIYDNKVQAVFDFNLDIKKHEFIVFVGPSGCGKSTTLRMIAGLEDITNGELYIDGELANEKTPKDRDIAMVFQSYALYPHMTVYDNMAFALKIRHLSKEEIDKRVHTAAKILQIEEYLDRKPKALSGGQRQRVALGRAIVRQAKVFLMDEPLSNLDAKLRVQMRSQIIKLHEALNATTIYVTHDQTEAMTMADKIVVMNLGVVQQIASPEEIYDYPANVFVSTFIGAPAMNVVPAKLENGVLTFESGKTIALPKKHLQYYKDYEGKDVLFGIRPEDFYLEEGDVKSKMAVPFQAKVDIVELLGFETIHYLDDSGVRIVAKVPHKSPYHQGDEASFYLDMSKYALFDKETTNRIKREK